MKTAFILAFILLLLSFHSNAQQTIDKLNVNQLKLPKESANKALILDGAGQVKSSSTISDTELGYLEGLSDTLVNLLGGKENTITNPNDTSKYYRGDKTFQTLDKSAVGLSNVDNTSDANKPISSATQTALNAKADDSVVVKLTGNQSISGTKTLTGKLIASSTLNASIPCPVMTQVQRDLFVAAQGDCVYNTTSLQLNIYDGSVWKSAGGSGGISLWLTGTVYAVNDVVIESDKIYRALIAHTSGTFATDLSAGKWTEVSASPSTPYSLANGGTNKALTAVNGGIVWVDADSFEVLSAGVSGQVLQSNGAGAPSWVNKSISAKAENGSSVTAEELQISNNQLTQVDTNKHLIESGNNNLLINPSFEHSAFSTGWTNSAGTFTQETVVEIHGKKAAKLVLSSQTMALAQDSSLYAAQFADGVQGLASIRIKSDVALKVCSRSAGVTSSSLCVDVQANNKWGLYKVPFILGATSNGISIASTGAVSGTVYIDDAFVGVVDLQADVDSSKIAGESYFAGTANCNWPRTSTTIGPFTSDADCPGPTVAKSYMGQWQTTDSDLPRQTINNLPAGKYKATFTFINNSTLSGETSFAINDGTSTCEAVGGNGTQANNSSTTVSCIFEYSSSGNRSFEIYAGSTSGTVNIPNSIITPRHSTKFNLEYFGSGSVYSSTNADTDWASCGHTAVDFTAFGTVTNIETNCKREGSDLLMRGKFTAGTLTAVEARVALRYGGELLTSAGTSVIPSLQIGGTAGQNGFGGVYYGLNSLIFPSIQYFVFGRQDSTGGELSSRTGSALGVNGMILSFNVRIPIEGWQNSNIIIGQFNGLESCSSTLDCTDTFSAKVSAAGVVSDENVNWINGNCSSGGTGFKVCSFNTNIFTVAPNCQMVSGVGSTGNFLTRISASSSSSATFLTMNTVATPVDGPFEIICQKQGVDYIGKTARAVSSDQNISTPGTIKSTLCSAKISATGVISDQKGGCFASCTNATTPVCTFTSNYWVSGQVPNCWHDDDGSGQYACAKNISSSTMSGSLCNNLNSSVSGNRVYICHGERQ